MAAQLVNYIDFDLDGVRTGTNAGKLIHHWGFDPAERFQNIGVGQSRLMSTIGGPTAGLSASIEDEAICKFAQPPDLAASSFGKTGIIGIEGVAVGDTRLILQDASGAKIDQVTIHVVKWRTVVIRFYNLIDQRSRQGINDPDTNPLFSKKALEDLVDAVNGIVMMQCDVMLFKDPVGIVRDLHFLLDLGPRVDINRLNPYASSDLDGAAEYHVAFVWGIDGHHSNGITRTNFTLLDAGPSADHRQITLAHEFAHFLSGSGAVTVNDHDDQKSDLMHKRYPHGIIMRKQRLLKIIHGI